MLFCAFWMKGDVLINVWMEDNLLCPFFWDGAHSKLTPWWYIPCNRILCRGLKYFSVGCFASCRKISPSKYSGCCMCPGINIKKFCVLPTECLFVSCVDLRTNCQFFPLHSFLAFRGVMSQDLGQKRIFTNTLGSPPPKHRFNIFNPACWYIVFGTLHFYLHQLPENHGVWLECLFSMSKNLDAAIHWRVRVKYVCFWEDPANLGNWEGQV
jgi:hypothetical protein